MKGQLTVISVGGTASVLEYNAEFNLQQVVSDIQESLQGDMEIVPHWDRYNDEQCIVFCNEIGKNIGLQRNAVATSIWDSVLVKKNLTRFNNGQEIDYLAGPIVIVTGDDDFMREILR